MPNGCRSSAATCVASPRRFSTRRATSSEHLINSLNLGPLRHCIGMLFRGSFTTPLLLGPRHLRKQKTRRTVVDRRACVFFRLAATTGRGFVGQAGRRPHGLVHIVIAAVASFLAAVL